jgi:hypothetical protein
VPPNAASPAADRIEEALDPDATAGDLLPALAALLIDLVEAEDRGGNEENTLEEGDGR